MGFFGGGGGGVTNSAGADVVTKSDGTNLVASRITDEGAGDPVIIAVDTDDLQVTSDFGEVKIGHTSNNHLVHLVAEDTVTAIDVSCETGGAIVALSNGAFTPAISALTSSSGDAIDAQSQTGYCVWAQSRNAANTLPTIVAQQIGASTANLFEAQNNGGTAIFAVLSSGGIFATLPTVNPAVVGRLWNDGGTVKVSAG